MIKELTIDRSIWAVPGRAVFSNLLNGSNQRCCLGFLGQACGVPDKFMRGHGVPSSLIYLNKILFPRELFDSIGDYFNELLLTQINDAQEVPDALREDWIRAGFKILLDIDITFIGIYPSLCRF